MKYSISEILFKAGRMKKREDKIAVLVQNESIPLLSVFQLAYEDHWEWDIPVQRYKYIQCNSLDAHGALYYQMKKVARYFLKGSAPHIPVDKKMNLWVQFLESIDKDDAELMLSVLTKKFPYRSLTKDLVAEAFPGIFREVTDGKEEVGKPA